MEKLALFTMSCEATVDDVDLLCGGERGATVWELVDGVLDGETAQAMLALKFLRSRGESVQGLLGQLVAAYRPLATVLDMLDEGASPEDIGKAIKRPWPGLRDRAIARARRLGRDGLLQAYEYLVTADRTVKLGEARDEIRARGRGLPAAPALAADTRAGLARPARWGCSSPPPDPPCLPLA